ncbi:MAG: hypothetical protein ACE37F_31615 [Nannocystaceae bacterium]|nr:hypothetical protein [bacterium]
MNSVYRTITTANGPRRALVVSPDTDELVGRETLDALRNRAVSKHHEGLVELVAEDPETVHVVVLRARGADGSGSFRMARDLDDQELEELGYLLARAQLTTWKALAEHGVSAFSRVELRVWELAALRSGTARLMAELETRKNDADRTRAAAAREDHWILGRALLNFGVGLDTALTELLPMRLEQLERERDVEGPAANSATE